MRRRLEADAEVLRGDPLREEAVRRLNDWVALLADLSFSVNLRSVQNIYFQILKSVAPEVRKRARRREKKALRWWELFQKLGHKLGMRID